MNVKRRPTSADRCEDCALHRRKELRFNGTPMDDEMFIESVETETPFWCHGPNEHQLCRGWIAIMERKWRKEGWDCWNPRERPRDPEDQD